ncbi:MAG: hypothetical protein JWQ39_2738 [Glaciihabitans sp.]|jgi:hypothetical protein|nr:hypothetical protein [Glaciihabitans sp.]
MTDPVTPEPTPAASVPPAAPVYAPAPAGPKQALSLTSFIVGLAGFVFGWVPFFGFIVGIAAVILGIIARKKEPAAPKWMWIVGIIAGAVGALTGLIVVILFIVGIIAQAALLSTIPYGN